jgi:DNA sulfur modification protein DndD
MKLKRLTMKNFMPYKGEVELVFPQDSARNTLIVFGDNMRGKTSLLNAIRWTFYGNAIGRHLRPIPLHQIPNIESASLGDWHMETRMEFEVDGVPYDLRRSANKRPLIDIPTKPDHFEVHTYLMKNGLAIIGDDLIEAEINQFAPEQVSRFFLFDGELLQEYEELLIEDGIQGKKIKEAIEQALGVPALINGRNDISNILKKAQKIQADEAANIVGLEEIVEELNSCTVHRESFDNDLLRLENLIISTRKERENLDDELETVDGIYQQKTELDLNKSRYKEIEEDISLKTQLRLQLVGQAWSDLLAPRLIAKREALSLEQKQLIDLIGERSRTQMQINQIEQYLTNSVCPTCHQATVLESKASKEQELEELRAKSFNHESDDKNLANITAQIQNLSKLINQGVGKRLTDIDNTLAHLECEYIKIENKIKDLHEKIIGFDTNKITRQRLQRDRLIREEERIFLEISGLKGKIIEANKEIRNWSRRITEKSSNQNGARASQRVILCEQLLAAFTQSIEKLREALRQTVEEKASEAFLAMSTQSNYQGLRINQSYGLTIIDQNGQEVPNRSAGAEQIVALSLIAGLTHAGRPLGPMVMDTPFGRLDINHRRNILAYLPNSASQLLLFVHDGEIRGELDLEDIAHKIDSRYEIREVTPTHSILVRS